MKYITTIFIALFLVACGDSPTPNSTLPPITINPDAGSGDVTVPDIDVSFPDSGSDVSQGDTGETDGSADTGTDVPSPDADAGTDTETDTPETDAGTDTEVDTDTGDDADTDVDTSTEPVLVSEGRTTSSSSDRQCQGTDLYRHSGLAVDGTTATWGGVRDGECGSFFASEEEAVSWWEVDLEGTYAVTEIAIFRRDQSSQWDDTRDFSIQVSEDGETWLDLTIEDYNFANNRMTVSTEGFTLVRHVRIEKEGVLALVEVQVFGY